ncbi:hypothetical protein KR026_006166, partial [Drosophila bipectinata]
TNSTKHSLWRAHPTLSSPKETVMPIRNSTGGWARSDADRASTFAKHLKNVFQPNPATNAFTLPTLSDEPQPQHEPIEFRPNEIVNIIKRQLNPKKSPGCDLITPKMIIELPYCAVCTLTQLFNAIAKLGHFPVRWKKSIIIMIAKPGKDHTIPTLGPTLYSIYASDMPTKTPITEVNEQDVLIATYADDTAVLTKSSSILAATFALQEYLDAFHQWATNWNIRVNADKCANVTFT